VCTDSAAAHDISASLPRPASGDAVDPIELVPVDEVVVTTVVDNFYDALLASDHTITRAPLAAGSAAAAQFESGSTQVGMIAEHGYSAMITVRRGDSSTSVLFDAGLSPDAMTTNADRLGLDLSGLQAVVLSHGHFDHVGGLAGLAGRHGPARCRWSSTLWSGPDGDSHSPAASTSGPPSASGRLLVRVSR
jgi:7,8-dihydropterin-6-yl-methyl-4-(beta-D-ribofuranosyl)aminobenzene 5'-phosphate synthase